MKRTLYILLAAVAILSCTKAQTPTVTPEQEIIPSKGKTVSFTVTATKEAPTKATLDLDNNCVVWSENDKNFAKLYNSEFATESGVTPSSFEISDDQKSVKITYTNVELKENAEQASDVFWFVFGAKSASIADDNKSINYTLPNTVPGANAQPVMVGVCETTNHSELQFNLKLAAAYVKIGINADTQLSKAEIFGADATTYIAGTCNFAKNGTKNGTITPVTSGSADNCHISVSDINGEKEFYVNLNPRNTDETTSTTDLTLILFNSDNQAMMRDLNGSILANPIHLTPSSYHEFIYSSFKPITITSTISATTTYSQYKAGQVSLANNTANTYRIWDIAASKTVTGIPASASRLENFIKPKYFCDEAELDGNVAENQEVKTHTISVNFIFDYLDQSILLASNVASTTAHITGLPYNTKKEVYGIGMNNGEWVQKSGGKYEINNNPKYLRIGSNGSVTMTLHIPSEIKTSVSYRIDEYLSTRFNYCKTKFSAGATTILDTNDGGSLTTKKYESSIDILFKSNANTVIVSQNNGDTPTWGSSHPQLYYVSISYK